MESKYHFRGLDLVRFFSACLVMIFHLGVVSRRLPISPNYGVVGAPDFPELSVFDIGWVGVEIFFVLSGLVIAQSADGKSAYRFLVGRAGRLLPAIWICATITLAAVLYFGMKPLGPVWSSYIKTMVIYPNGPWISNVYWTLVVEIFFYGSVFAILLSNSFKHIESFAGLLIVCSGAYLAVVTLFGLTPIHTYFLAQHGCFFGLGILIWLISAKGVSNLRITLSGLALAACLVEICFVGNGRLAATAFWLAPLVWMTAVAAICASVMLPVKSSKFAQTLGLMTYPLYLVHEKLGSGILRVAPWTGRWLALFLAISIVIAISFLVVTAEPFIRHRLEMCLDWLVKRYVPKKVFAVIAKNTVAVEV